MDLSLPQVFVEWGLTLLFIWLFTKHFVGPIGRHLDQRAAKVREDYEAAEARRTEMEELKLSYEERIAQVEEEVREHLAAAVVRGETLMAEMKAKAERATARTMARMERELDAMRERLRIELRKETARLVIAVSERFLTKRMDTQDEALVERLMAEVSQSLEA